MVRCLVGIVCALPVILAALFYWWCVRSGPVPSAEELAGVNQAH